MILFPGIKKLRSIVLHFMFFKTSDLWCHCNHLVYAWVVAKFVTGIQLRENFMETSFSFAIIFILTYHCSRYLVQNNAAMFLAIYHLHDLYITLWYNTGYKVGFYQLTHTGGIKLKMFPILTDFYDLISDVPVSITNAITQKMKTPANSLSSTFLCCPISTTMYDIALREELKKKVLGNFCIPDDYLRIFKNSNRTAGFERISVWEYQIGGVGSHLQMSQLLNSAVNFGQLKTFLASAVVISTDE